MIPDAEVRRLFRKVQRRLNKGMDLTAIANDLDMNYNTLYARIDRAGYTVERTGRLVRKDIGIEEVQE